jgi:hypothetical protein
LSVEGPASGFDARAFLTLIASPISFMTATLR